MDMLQTSKQAVVLAAWANSSCGPGELLVSLGNWLSMDMMQTGKRRHHQTCLQYLLL
jgi:hypothetical protein